MTTLLSDQSATFNQLSGPSCALRLKVTQSGGLINQFDLPEGKCTIGSSPSCQIQLTTTYARPLQCLIVRKGQEITVTRWAAGILLNDVEFVSAPFRVGDFLKVGNVQLELVSPETENGAPEPEKKSPVTLLEEVEAKVAAAVDPINEPTETLVTQAVPAADTSATADEADLARLHSANQQARQRFRRLIGTLRELREESRGLDQHVNLLTEQLQTAQQAQERLSAELIQSQAVAAERESQFSEELDRAIAELSASYERANAAEQGLQTSQNGFHELQERIDSLTAECVQLQETQTSTGAEKQQLEQTIAQREAELAQWHEEYWQLRQTLEAALADMQQQNHELQRQLSEATARLETPDPEAANLASELATACEERQEIANENQRLSQEIVETEERAQLLEIDVRSITAEWQQAQTTITRLQESCLLAESQAADLRTKLADLETATASEWSTERHNLSTQLAELQEQLAGRVQDLTEIAAEREQVSILLTTSQQELAERQEQLADAYRQLTDLQASVTHTEKERTQLAAELSARDAQTAELADELKQTQERLSAELAARESGSAEYASEQGPTQEQLMAELNLRETCIAELTKQLEQTREQVAAELDAQDARIAELTSELQYSQRQLVTELNAPQTRIAELTAELQHLQEHATSELNSRDTRIAEIAAELEQTQQEGAAQLAERDSHIAALTAELQQTQEELTDCAAQGERLNGLYQEVQLELDALKKSRPMPLPDEPEASAASPTRVETIAEMHLARSFDPRDDYEPRIAQQTADVASEPTTETDEQPSEPHQPPSFIEHYSHLIPEEDETETLPSASQPQAPELNDIGSDDSEALEAYMANMMKRVRGETSSETITPPMPRVSEADEGSVRINPVERMNTLTRRVATPAEPEPTTAEKLIGLHELKGTSQKPPVPTNLVAMRELANISARQAIAKHRKRRHFEGALSKLLVSAIAGGTAAAMIMTAEDIMSPVFLAGCGVAIVSAFWGFKLASIVLEMIRDGNHNERTPAELSEMEDPLPIDGSAE